MIKLLILIGVFICSGYSEEEKNTADHIGSNEQQLQTELLSVRDNFNNQLEKKSRPCQENNNDKLRLSGRPVLPVTKKVNQFSVVSTDNNFVPETLHDSDQNYRRYNPNIEKVDSELVNKKSDDYLIESNKNIEKLESLTVDIDKRTHMNTKKLDNLCKYDPNRNEKHGLEGNIDTGKDLPVTRRILPGIVKNLTNEESQYNKLFAIKPQSTRRMLQDNINIPPSQESKDDLSDNMQSELNERQGIISSADKRANNYNTINVNDMKYIPLEDSFENQLMEPTKGRGISNMKDASVMLLENSRVCYACSTMTDPSCWSPSSETTVKYCQKGHNSCLTKTFKYKEISFIIRDCGSYCVNPSGDRYSSCSICHSDLCNGASTICNIYNTGVLLLAALFGIFFSKS